MSSYSDLTREQLLALLEKRDRTKKLGLVWERDEIEADKAIDANFVAATLDSELSLGHSGAWENLVIEGDNFDALRWLRMTFAGKVKCIYVDPPYNTGSTTFVYNDRFLSSDDRFRNSTWLEWLYRRFLLARDLLTTDGVILVSINDENRAYMELMLDEALPGIRIGSIVWRSRKGGNHEVRGFVSQNHEHILVFGNSDFSFGGTAKDKEKYTNEDKDRRGPWMSDNLTVSYDWKSKSAGSLFYPVHDPKTDTYYPCNPDRVWGWASRKHSKSKSVKTKFMEDLIADGRVIFPTDQRVVTWKTVDELSEAMSSGDVPTSNGVALIRPDLPNLDFWIGKRVGFGVPRYKRFYNELRRSTQPLSSWVIPHNELATADSEVEEIASGYTDEGSREIKSIFKSKVFLYPKPPSLIHGLVHQSTSPGDIVCDFFAGSATTAQAVMELNAEDRGGRTFIMVSSTEATDTEPNKNICRDITAERIRRVSESDDPKYANLSTGFAYQNSAHPLRRN